MAIGWPPGSYSERRLDIQGAPDAFLVRYGDPRSGEWTTGRCAVWDVNRQEVPGNIADLDAGRIVDLDRFGTTLGWFAFPGEVHDHVLEDLFRAESEATHLRIGISEEPGPLGAMPWEYLRVGGATAPLGIHPACSLYRVVASDNDEAPTPLDGEPLRILLVCADPHIEGCARLAAQREVGVIRGLLRRLPQRVRIRELLPCADAEGRDSIATRRNLGRLLAEWRPQLVVWISHGRYDAEERAGQVYLEGADGGADPVKADELGALMGASEPHLVLLGACSTADSGPDGRGTSVARALAGPLRAVVAMQLRWPAVVAPTFARYFLDRLLAHQSPVDVAAGESREFLHRLDSVSGDWGRPVVFRPAPREQPPSAPRKTWLWRAELDRVVADLEKRVNADAVRLLQIESLGELISERLGEADGEAGAFLEYDPVTLFFAGDGDTHATAVELDPVWTTHLLKPPEQIRWRGGDAGSCFVELFGADTRLAWGETTDRSFAIESSVLQAWPLGRGVRCEVEQQGRVLVRGVLQVSTPDECEDLERQVGELERGPGGIASHLAVAQAYIGKSHFQAAIDRLRVALDEHPSGSDAFAAHRSLAVVYRRVAEALTGPMRLGDPEGLWAARTSRWHLQAAYRALGF